MRVQILIAREELPGGSHAVRWDRISSMDVENSARIPPVLGGEAVGQNAGKRRCTSGGG